ncbi:hypothetical protein F5Y06DRAFT_277162 [Hypoxylon sp. FL0890]|nr:hypothetical protein F5Y06DRAFT_277162 [Hypoxylon sp. FL0890]
MTRRSRTAKTMPGKSTHPYDTGVGETTTSDEDSRQQTPPSRQAERVTSSREQTPRTSDWLRSSKRVRPSLSRLGERNLAPRSQKNHGLNGTPERRVGEGNRSQPRIKFRSILRLNKNRRRASNTSPSEDNSIPTVHVETEAETPLETWTKRWWYLKKRRVRDELSRSSLAEEGDDLAAFEGSRCTWKSIKTHRPDGYPGGKIATNTYDNRSGNTRRKSGRGRNQRQKVDMRSEKTASDLSTPQADRVLSKALGPKLLMRRRKSVSSSQARPSTTGPSSTPATTIHRDFAREYSRETPSPISVLRLLLSQRKTPPSRPATQSGPRGHRDRISTSIDGQSRDSRTPGRQSTGQKHRAWIPFWGPSKPQPEDSLRDNADETSRRRDYLEPAPREPSRSGSANQKWLSERVSRMRWRSG